MEGADASATLLEIVSAAVFTVRPVVSVPVSVPTLVETFAVLKYVPPVVPAFTVKMNVRVEVAGSDAAGEKVHVNGPVALTLGVVAGEPIVPAPVLWYVKPFGSVSVTELTVTAVLEVLLSVSVNVTGCPCCTFATLCVFVTVGGGAPHRPPIVTF